MKLAAFLTLAIAAPSAEAQLGSAFRGFSSQVQYSNSYPSSFGASTSSSVTSSPVSFGGASSYYPSSISSSTSYPSQSQSSYYYPSSSGRTSTYTTSYTTPSYSMITSNTPTTTDSAPTVTYTSPTTTVSSTPSQNTDAQTTPNQVGPITQPLTPASVFLPSISAFTEASSGRTTAVSALPTDGGETTQDDRRQVQFGSNIYKKDSPGTTTAVTSTYSPATSVYAKGPVNTPSAATNPTYNPATSIYAKDTSYTTSNVQTTAEAGGITSVYGKATTTGTNAIGTNSNMNTGPRQVVSYDFDGTLHVCDSPLKCPNNPQVWIPVWETIERAKKDNENYDIIITTARKPVDNHLLWQFLWMVGLGDIIKGIYNSETKVEVLAQLGAIAHHDDNDKHLEDIERALPQVDSFEADPFTGSMSVYTKKSSSSSRGGRSGGGGFNQFGGGRQSPGAWGNPQYGR